MNGLEFELSNGGYVNRFLVTGMFTEPQRFEKAVLTGRVNEWLKKGFSIHENPCRKEFIAKRKEELPPYLDLTGTCPGDEAEVFGQKRKLELYFPFGNIGYEDSGFYFCPTYLRTYGYVELRAEKAETARFEVETCGGATVWNNGQLAADFIPFTRNMRKRTTITIPLQAGKNQLVFCLDDLAERDTDYYIRLRYQGGQHLKLWLPLPEQADAEKLDRYEKLLGHISFTKEAYLDEPVVLELPPQLLKKDHLQVTMVQGEGVEKMRGHGQLETVFQYDLMPDQKELEVLHTKDRMPGFYFFDFAFFEGEVRIHRKLGNQLVWSSFLEKGPESSEERKKIMLETIAGYGVDNVQKAAAIYGLNGDLREAERIIFEEIGGVQDRQDCSDFHFTTILYLYQKYGESMSQSLREVIRQTALSYRYWIDEPGDDVMWFFSENHALLFHLCQYLAGRLWPEDWFENSQKTGKEVARRGAELLQEWFEEFFSDFITEWNSNAYIPVDVHGLATLYNVTEPENPLHEQARRALDQISRSLAINAHKGAVMTSFGRTYEKELKGNYNAGTTGLLYLFFNEGYRVRSGMGTAAVALGSYEAPEEYRRYIRLEEGESLTFENTQGFEQHVNLYMYKNAQVQLSTAVAFRPFQNGYQEHIMQATIDEAAQVFINHPGEVHPYGSGRPNFWAGNCVCPCGVQYKHTGILLFDAPEDCRIDYTHAYIPLSEFQEYKGQRGSIVLEKDEAYIGVRALNGLTIQKSGPTAYREFISPGRRNVWIMRVAAAENGMDLDGLLEELEQMTITIDEDRTVWIRDGKTEYRLDPSNELSVNGKRVHSYPLTPEGKLTFEGDET